MFHYLTIGLLLGLAAGLAPGPLLALVIAETLRHGIGAGVRVALSPIVTDAPIIVLTLYVLSRLSDYHGLLGALSIAGGLFLLYLGGRELFRRNGAVDAGGQAPGSLARGILANVLSPHPYLFWLTVGAPTMARSLEVGIFAAVAFIAGFYLCLVGAKIVLAILVGKSRTIFSSSAYRITLRLLGAALCLFAIALFVDGLSLLQAF